MENHIRRSSTSRRCGVEGPVRIDMMATPYRGYRHKKGHHAVLHPKSVAHHHVALLRDLVATTAGCVPWQEDETPTTYHHFPHNTNGDEADP